MSQRKVGFTTQNVVVALAAILAIAFFLGPLWLVCVRVVIDFKKG